MNETYRLGCDWKEAGLRSADEPARARAISGNSLQRGRCRNTAGAWSSPRHGRVADAIKGPANRLARAKKGK